MSIPDRKTPPGAGGLSRRLQIVIAVGILVASGVALSLLWSRSQSVALEQLHDVKYPLDSLLGTLRALHFPTPEVRKETEKRLGFELAVLKGVISKVTSVEQLRSTGQTIDRIAEVCPTTLKKQLDGLGRLRLARAETLDFDRLGQLVARDQAYAGIAEAFLKKYPKSERTGRVDGWLHRANQRAEMKDLEELDAFKPASREEFERKQEMMLKFVARFPHARDSTDIKQAVEITQKLLQARSFRVKAVSAGRFNTARDFSVKISVDGKERLEVPSPGPVKETNWDRVITVEWMIGQPMKVVLFDYDWKNEDAATREEAGLLAIRLLDGRKELDPVGSWDAYFEGKPFVTFQTVDFSAEDWSLIDRYVIPSNR